MKKLIVPAFVLALALILLFMIRNNWGSWKSDAAQQSTNDAYVVSNQITLSTRITGTVHQVDVGDYQVVKAGQLILELDDVDFKATADEAQASIDAARAELAANQDAKRAANAAIVSAQQAIAQAQAAASSASLAVVAEQAQATRAGTEFHRQDVLLADRAATHQAYEQALEARDASQAELEARQADAARAQAAMASSRAALAGVQAQRAELNAKDADLQAQVDAKIGAFKVANVNLAYAKIYAPADGQVGKFQVHPGQLVSAGMQVVNFVQNGPWVEANFQETQLARVRIGDVADVTVDAYPGRTFAAQVAEIAPASGSATALLPPDNATGNFTKVVQRVPIKLTFCSSADAAMLRPGFSARVTIHTNQLHAASCAAANASEGK